MERATRVEIGITRRRPARPKQLNGRSYAEVYDVAVKVRRQDGTYTNIVERGFVSIRDARARRDELAGDRHRAAAAVGGDLGDLLAAWHNDPPAGLKASTVLAYSIHIRNYLIPAFDGLDIRELRTKVIEERLDLLARKHSLKLATVKRIHATLSRILADLVEDGKIPANPASLGKRGWSRVSGIRAARRLPAWREGELRTFLEAARDDRLFPFFRFLAYTGCRRGEALGLRWENLDLHAASVYICETMGEVAGIPTPSTPKTESGVRVISLDPETVRIIRAWREDQDAEASAREGYNPTGLVFTNRVGNAWKGSKPGQRFSEIAAEAGLRHIPLHGLRHTHATISIRAGVPLKVVSQRLGHASVAITAEIYLHADERDDRSSVAAFAAAIPDGEAVVPLRGRAS